MLPSTYYALSYSSALNFVGILARIDKLDESTRYTEFVAYEQPADDWGRDHFLRDIRARSVIFRSPHTWVIGDRGEVWCKIGQQLFKDKLPDSGIDGPRHLGQPNRVRLVAGRPYICGFAGQFYTLAGKLEDRKWLHMDDGLAEPQGSGDSIDLEDLDGTAANDIYTVGSDGLIARWDGLKWERIKVLTNAHLAAVRCISPSHVVAVGNAGVFVEFDGKDWRVDQIPGAERFDLADIQHYGDRLYVAAGPELFVRSGTSWQRAAHGLASDKTDFYHLTVGGDRLWAIGKKRLNSFDGKKWVAHIDPDNG